jgi:sulfate transport system permease protein
VILPSTAPALLTGFALAFARAVGEYGSVIFIAGNMPMVSEITPLMIISKLEQYDYAGATAVAVGDAAVLVRAAVAHQRPAGLDQRKRSGGNRQ